MQRADAAAARPGAVERRATRRGPGRPRSTRHDALVLAATLVEIADHGIRGLAIERVAARAGVSKVTVYRRWPDKIALALAALGELPELAVPDTGTLLGDLRALRADLVRVAAESPLGHVLPALLAERQRSEHGPAIGRYIEQRSAPFALIVRRSMARGELATTLPAELVTEMLSAPLAMSILNRDTPLSEAEWVSVVTTIVRGLRADDEGAGS